MKNENKKHLVFRNLILGLTLLVCIFIAVIAWFSSVSKADANGLTVSASNSGGLEVSLDGTNYSASSVTVENTHVFPLITSNGSDFILPRLNLSTGEPLKDENGNWAVKRDAVANEDYLETDIYFRSTEQLDVSLAGDSNVSPKKEEDGTLGNISDFGDFSRNYIAGASRVGFYDKSDNLQFIWAPNLKYELSNGGNYTKIEKKSEGGSSGSGSFNPSGGSSPVDWWMSMIEGGYPGIDSGYEDIQQKTLYYYDYVNSNKLSSTQMKYNKNTGCYDGVLDFADQYSNNMIAVFDNGQSVAQDFKQYDQWIAATPDNGTLLKKGFDIYYDMKTTRYEPIPYNQDIPGSGGDTKYSWVQLYLRVNSNPENYTQWQVHISYNPTTKVIKVEDFIFYKDSQNYVATDGVETLIGGGAPQSYYELDTEKSMIIASSEGYGLSVDNDAVITQQISSYSSSEITFVPSEFIFKPESGSVPRSYKIKHINSNKYLSVSGDSLILSDTASEFKLSAGTNGPLLYCNGYYIGYTSGGFDAVSVNSTAIEIFQGNVFTFNDNGIQQSSYTCLEKNKDTETSLNRASGSVSSISSLSSTPIVDDLSYINDVPIVKLAKENETDKYYTAHIKVRIWIEGTDREAKTPLMNGVFNALLSFTGAKANANQTQ